MRDSVTVLGVGGPAGFNVAKAAHAAGYQVYGFDSSPAMLPLANEVCAETHVLSVVPRGNGAYSSRPVICQPEALLPHTAELRDSGLINYHGPRTSVLTQLADKYVTVLEFEKAGLRSGPVRIGPEIPDWLHIAQDKFGKTFWLRADSGAGASGAMLVHDLREAYHWIRLHEIRFGMEGRFIAEEYLPGRDYCWTALYHEGERVASFARERLEWLYPRLAPFSGRTGTPTRARIVHDDLVSTVGRAAVQAIDDQPHGVYCVDMRENVKLIPRPTEINAGRWATTSPAYYEFGPNLVAAHIRLAYGDDPGDVGDDCYPAGAEVLRHIDMGSTFRV